jgi:hypothetical protein
MRDEQIFRSHSAVALVIALVKTSFKKNFHTGIKKSLLRLLTGPKLSNSMPNRFGLSSVEQHPHASSRDKKRSVARACGRTVKSSRQSSWKTFGALHVVSAVIAATDIHA